MGSLFAVVLLVITIIAVLLLTEFGVAALEPTLTPTQDIAFVTMTPPAVTPTAPAAATATFTATPLPPTPTPTPLPTQTPTLTVTPIPTSTPLPPTPTPVPTITDWRGAYWSNSFLSGSPALVRNDPVIDFDWGFGAPAPGLPVDNFSAQWTQDLFFERGLYRFHLAVDDGAQLWVDDQLVASVWQDGSREIAADYVLDRGLHNVRLEYYESSGYAHVQLDWERIETNAFPEWRGEYWSNPDLAGEPLLVRNDSAISFNWGAGAPAPGLPVNNFSARWSSWVDFEPGSYRFFARADDGIRIYIDGNRILDEWHLSSGSQVYTVDIPLEGRDWVVVEYFENTGEALVGMEFERLGGFPTPTYTPTRTPTATPILPTPTFTPDPETLALNAAISHLAALTGLPRSTIAVVSTEPVVWQNTLLGCPRPGVIGQPVLTPGYRIILAAGGNLYEYHTDREGQIVLCQPTPTPTPTLTATPTSTPLPPPTATDTPTATPEPEETALNAAISHLVALTGLPRSEITLISIEPVDWPNSLLGCPAQRVIGAPVITPGYRIILEARGERYEYHTDREGQVVLCQATPTPTSTPPSLPPTETPLPLPTLTPTPELPAATSTPLLPTVTGTITTTATLTPTSAAGDLD